MCITSPWQRTVLASQEHWAGHMARVLATIITNTVTNIVTLAAAILTNYGDYNFPAPLLMVLVTLMVTTLLLNSELPQCLIVDVDPLYHISSQASVTVCCHHKIMLQ